MSEAKAITNGKGSEESRERKERIKSYMEPHHRKLVDCAVRAIAELYKIPVEHLYRIPDKLDGVSIRRIKARRYLLFFVCEEVCGVPAYFVSEHFGIKLSQLSQGKTRFTRNILFTNEKMTNNHIPLIRKKIFMEFNRAIGLEWV